MYIHKYFFSLYDFIVMISERMESISSKEALLHTHIHKIFIKQIKINATYTNK